MEEFTKNNALCVNGLWKLKNCVCPQQAKANGNKFPSGLLVPSSKLFITIQPKANESNVYYLRQLMENVKSLRL